MSMYMEVNCWCIPPRLLKSKAGVEVSCPDCGVGLLTADEVVQGAPPRLRLVEPPRAEDSQARPM